MVRTVLRGLGTLLLLLPLGAVAAMAILGVPRLAPRVVLPDWQTEPRRSSLATTIARTAATTPAASMMAEPARRLPATRRPAHRAAAPSESATRATEATGWSQAVGRLRELGVREYRLQPGVGRTEVHFSCVVRVPGHPRVVRRYEAEAADPVAAARDVLRQIEQAAGPPRVVSVR